MKKIFKVIGTFSILCFSFFYTDKVITVVSDKDPLKQEIINVSDNYKIVATEAIVNGDEIIPGINGRSINVEKTYKRMRNNNVFNNNLIVYDDIYPEYRLINNRDKYIIRGNVNKHMVSILLLVDNNYYLDNIINIINNKEVNINLFVSYEYLNNNISNLKNIDHNIYLYSDNYTYDTLLISNNIIKRISNTNPIYCLSNKKNDNTLKVCNYLEMYTIIPTINGDYNTIKKEVSNGSIILIESNYSTFCKISNIIDFILSKGYDIVTLDKLLDESI